MDWLTQNREKKRMGIALRRYVTLRSPCYKHASYFGCDARFLRDFIEHQFTNGMTWDNFGKVWQIDHILPLSIFDQELSEDMVICWNWANLRPLKVDANKSRNSYRYALSILENRMRHFPKNKMLTILVEAARSATESEEIPEVDWELFSKNHL